MKEKKEIHKMKRKVDEKYPHQFQIKKLPHARNFD